MNSYAWAFLFLVGVATARDVLGLPVSFHASDACGGAPV